MASKSKPGGAQRPLSIYEYGISQQKVFNARIEAIRADQKKKQVVSAKDQLQNAKDTEAKLWAQKVAKEKTLSDAKAYYQERLAFFKTSGSDGGTSITSTEQTFLDGLTGGINSLTNELNVLKKKYSDAVATRKTLEKSTTSGKPKPKLKPKPDSSGGGQIESAGYQPPVSYIYNAPMVKTAYLNQGLSGDSRSPQQQTSTRPIAAPSPSTDGRLSWSDTTQASKGIIQMSLEYLNVSNTTGTNPANYDDKLYGFKFLYNPKEVAMTWGVSSGVNPEVIQTGQDKSSFIGLGLAESTISFSLLLNRTLDMEYLDSNGLKDKAINPYPYGIDDAQLKEIYNRGTMHDMEYLFKAINGFNSTYSSSLNKVTADIGWLNGTAVELHLGDGLRYLVRIGGLDVNHTIFNERMVPILSTVNITCHRFYDNPQYDGSTTSHSTSGGTTP